MFRWTKWHTLFTLPLVGAGYYWTNYTAQYPPEAKKYLRRALLQHDYGIGNPVDTPFNYRMAMTETAKKLPMYSPEMVGILEKMSDWHETNGSAREYVQTLDTLFEALTDDNVKNLEDKQRHKCATSCLKAAQKLAEYHLKTNEDKAFFYYTWIVDNSVRPLNLHGQTPKIGLQPWASVRQVGVAFDQLGTLYSNKRQFDHALPAFARALEMLEQDKDLDPIERKQHETVLYFNMGQCFSQMNQPQAAEKYLDHALSKSIGKPFEATARVEAALFKRSLGKKQDADKLLQEGLASSQKAVRDAVSQALEK